MGQRLCWKDLKTKKTTNINQKLLLRKFEVHRLVPKEIPGLKLAHIYHVSAAAALLTHPCVRR